jgi:hypothetical protein
MTIAQIPLDLTSHGLVIEFDLSVLQDSAAAARLGCCSGLADGAAGRDDEGGERRGTCARSSSNAFGSRGWSRADSAAGPTQPETVSLFSVASPGRGRPWR